MDSKLSYCGALVKRHDPERFLLSLFFAPEMREALWALFAFNYEIARTREVVTETQLGLIRLQWWREAIAKIYAGEVFEAGEVLGALADAIRKYSLPYEDFERLIFAREFDLEDVLPGTLEGLLNYADFTTTPLLRLAVRVTGGNADAEPVQPVAVNYALAGLLQAVRFHAGQRRCYLPEDLLHAHKINPSQIYEGRPPENLPSVVAMVCGEILPGIQCSSRFLILSQRLALMRLNHIKSLKYNVFNPRAALPPPFMALRLGLGALLEKNRP